MRRSCGVFGRSLGIVSWSVAWSVASAVLVAVAVRLRRTGCRKAANPGPVVPEDVRRTDVRGAVHALLGPRGLVAVGELVEPARWLGAVEPPGRGGVVRLTREEGAGVWDAWPLDEPREGGGVA